MAQDGALHPRRVRAPEIPAERTHGCRAGDHHEGCGHTALMTRAAPLQVTRPDDAVERAADEAMRRVSEGLPAFDRRPPGARPAGGAAANALRPAGAGRALEPDVRRAGEEAFAADLSAVRVHDDARSDALSRHLGADAFTVGTDVYFRRGVYGSARPEHRQVVSHELAHVSLGSGEAIARHASWEHKMLGDVDPADLELIAAGRDLVAEKKAAKKEKRPEKTISTQAGQVIDADMVLHTLQQEIDRLQTFARNPPTVATKEEEEKRNKEDTEAQKAKAKESKPKEATEPQAQAEARKWDVRLVSIPLKDGTAAILTYGEVNTLADFYGSPAEIQETDPQQFRNFVFGVREESIRKFMRLHNEISSGLGRKETYDPDADEHKVKVGETTSMGNVGRRAAESSGIIESVVAPVVGGVATGVTSSDAYSELKLMGAVPGAEAEKKKEVEGRAETSYTAGLARNACHFAPQSWHAWGSAHEGAVKKAKESFVKRTEAKKQKDDLKVLGTTDWRAFLEPNKIEEDADRLKSEALLENGFADHFLQDSYAAGHLINKTLIMQWFAKWLDENSMKRDYTSADTWRQVQNMAYGQKGLAAKQLYTAEVGKTQATDAQSVENMKKVGDRAATWQDRFAALGLTVPASLRASGTPEFMLFTWWQEQAGRGKYMSSNVNELSKYGPVPDKSVVSAALNKLISDGVVYYDSYSTSDRAKGPEAIGLTTFGIGKSLRLKKEYIPTDAERFSAVVDEDNPDPAAYKEMAESTTLADYHAFLNHGYLQLSTNALHDYFCQNGLWVDTDAGTTGYKVYGDNAMLQSESSKGVEFSSKTSHMSRDAIYDYASTGNSDNTTKAIDARIPKAARTVKDNVTVRLEDWHGEGAGLKKLCWDTVFPNCAALFSKSTAVAKEKLAPLVSADVGAGEPF